MVSEAHEREKLERLCRYITRPAVSTERLSLTAQGKVRYRLVAPAHPCARDIRASLHIKTPYRDGTREVVLLRAFCPTPFGPAFGCSKSLPAILLSRSTLWPDWQRWYRRRESTSRVTTASLHRITGDVNK